MQQNELSAELIHAMEEWISFGVFGPNDYRDEQATNAHNRLMELTKPLDMEVYYKVYNQNLQELKNAKKAATQSTELDALTELLRKEERTQKR